jgi:hypothetical protein
MTTNQKIVCVSVPAWISPEPLQASIAEDCTRQRPIGFLKVLIRSRRMKQISYPVLHPAEFGKPIAPHVEGL